METDRRAARYIRLAVTPAVGPADCDVEMAQHYTKRLSDKILIAFHHACDERNTEVARALLDLLELMARRSPSLLDRRERHLKDSLVAAHERLWHIQHPHGPEFQ